MKRPRHTPVWIDVSTVELYRIYRGIRAEQELPEAKLHLLANSQVKFEEEAVYHETVPHGSWVRVGEHLHLTYSWKGDTSNMKNHVFRAVHSGTLTVYRHLETDRTTEEHNPCAEWELIPWMEE